jgi:hypothetical protein
MNKEELSFERLELFIKQNSGWISEGFIDELMDNLEKEFYISNSSEYKAKEIKKSLFIITEKILYICNEFRKRWNYLDSENEEKKFADGYFGIFQKISTLCDELKDAANKIEGDIDAI